ncbi:uncharacterized protein LOC111872430 isoform X2 [Cryptotermes secundus]|nr:uncharacterized protein LOC111872430 isoform X2 [Cryptotermes secundus]
MESFPSGDHVRSLNSSPVDIFWSPSANRDVDMISSSCALRRVVTRLDFDSCVSQSPDASCQFRSRVTDSVINAENRDRLRPDATVLDDSKGKMCTDMIDSRSVSPQNKGNQGDSAVASCDEKFSKKIPHEFNKTHESKFSLQTPVSHISGTGNFTNVTASSPVIRKKKLSPGVRSFRIRKRWRGESKKEVNDPLQQEILCQEHTSLLLSSQRGDRKGSRELNTQTEAELHLKNNVRLTTVHIDLSSTVAENELSQPASSQRNKPSVSDTVSPVMKCDHRKRNRKHRDKVSHSGKNSLNNTDKLDRSGIQENDVGLKETDAAGSICSPDLNISPSSPVLVKSREKRFRRRKVMMTVKSGDCIDKKEFLECSRVSGNKDVLLCDHAVLDTPQRKHMHSECNNIHGPITLRDDGKTDDDSALRESQKPKNCDAKGDSVYTEDVEVSNESKGSELSVVECSIEADITVEKECNGICVEKSINSSTQEICKVLNERGQCGRKSENMEAKALFPNFSHNILCRSESMLLKRREWKCDIEVKKEIPDVTSTEPLIETETSLDISMDDAAVCHHNDVPQDVCGDELSLISSPTLSAESHDLDLMISSCSTPKSDKSGALARHRQEAGGEDGVISYMDSGKKKKRRLRLNKSGLAARLQKLLARVHSSTRIWQHEADYSNVLRSSKRGILLEVHSVWAEYSHLLVHCASSSGKFVSPPSSDGDDSCNSDVNTRIIIVLDPSLHIHIKPWTTIRIYPPWQRLIVSRLNVTLVLGVSCVEEVKAREESNWIVSSRVQSQQRVTETLYTCPCSCLQDLRGGNKCLFHFPHNGLEFLEHLLPQEIPMRALHCSTADIERVSNTGSSEWQVTETGTIAEAIVNQGCLVSEESYLQLYILQVFHYKSRGDNKTNQDDATPNSVSWSILGCDATGECCEVLLGHGPSSIEMSHKWTSIMSRQAIGHFCRLTGFTLMKRIHRTKNPSLWSMITKCKEQIGKQNLSGKEEVKNSEPPKSFVPICNLKERQVISELQSLEGTAAPACRALQTGQQKADNSSQETSGRNSVQRKASELGTSLRKGQLFAYVFSPSTESWEMEQLERAPHGQKISVLKPQVSCLAHSLQGTDVPARYTYMAKLIYATEDRLYVADSSLLQVNCPGYVIISVKPSCFTPSQMTDNRAAVLLLQDILLDKGNLNADKYSRLTPISNDTVREADAWFPLIPVQELNLISNMKIILPNLTSVSVAKELVTVTGTVRGVDEETAFVWPVCGICENDLLIELGPNEYLCQKCNSSSQTSTKMSLEVFISCPEIPEPCKVKVKLQQNSIVDMLPTSQENSQGYPLSSVLDHAIGPLCCIVVRGGTNNFILNEIPTLR